MLKRHLQSIILGCLLAFLAGCGHYHLGVDESVDLSGRIFIPPVVNNSEAPQVRALLTEHLRREFAKHPAWRLAASRREADYQLEVSIIEFGQNIAAVSTEDTGRGASFDLNLTAMIALTSSRGIPEETARVEAHTVVFATPGQPETIYQAMPGLSLKLAEAILSKVTYR